MPRTTDLLRVKLVAHTLLDAQIQKTASAGTKRHQGQEPLPAPDGEITAEP